MSDSKTTKLPNSRIDAFTERIRTLERIYRAHGGPAVDLYNALSFIDRECNRDDRTASDGNHYCTAHAQPWPCVWETEQSEDVLANNRDAAMTPPILGGDHEAEPSSIPVQRTSLPAEAGTSGEVRRNIITAIEIIGAIESGRSSAGATTGEALRVLNDALRALRAHTEQASGRVQECPTCHDVVEPIPFEITDAMLERAMDAFCGVDRSKGGDHRFCCVSEEDRDYIRAALEAAVNG